MASSDDSACEVDFRLVTTYIPVLMLLMRSGLLVVVVDVCQRAVTWPSSLFVLVVVLVYFDAYLFRAQRLNRVCGFLAPVALGVYVSARYTTAVGGAPLTHCAGLHVAAMHWAVDLAWAVTSSFFLASQALHLRLPVDVVSASMVWAACLVAHAILACSYTTPGEVVFRAVFYYVSCMIHYYSMTFLDGIDRNAFAFAVMHVSLHMMFVEVYVLLGSSLVFAFLYARIYYDGMARGRVCGADPHAPARRSSTPPRGVLVESSDLVRELRLAQATSREP